MSSWEDELQHLLNELGVELEQAQQKQAEHESALVVTHASLSHPGVFYRLELADVPHVYIYMSAIEGPCKLQVYHTQLASDNALLHLFALFLAYSGGSPVFQEVEGETTYHLFMAVTQTMKALFWKGDLAAMQFPPEINVERLL
jgi:hypothetical protein